MPSRTVEERYRRFAVEYVKDLNATQAYQRAGYKARGKSAEINALRLLRNARVQAYIEAELAKCRERIEVERDEILLGLLQIARGDLRRVATWGPDGLILTPSEELEDDAALAIQEVTMHTKRRIEQTDDGDVVTIEEVRGKAKMYSKLDAYEKLGKYLKLFTDKLDIRGKLSLEELEQKSDGELQQLLEEREDR